MPVRISGKSPSLSLVLNVLRVSASRKNSLFTLIFLKWAVVVSLQPKLFILKKFLIDEAFSPQFADERNFEALTSLCGGPVDMLISNPPYITSKALEDLEPELR